jgi:exopolysaccharide biosynthesis polyprenyl glycosylphosphotransferase
MGLSTTLIWLEKSIIFMSSHYLRRQGLNTRRLLIVGTGKRAIQFIKRVDQHPEWGFEFLGAIDDEPSRGIRQVGRLKVIGTLEDIPNIFHRDAIDEVVFLVPRSRLNSLQGAIDDCETEGVVVTVAVDLFDTKLARSSVAELDGLPLLHFRTTRAKEWELLVKRLFDFTASGLGIIVLSPLFLVMAFLIKVTSKGPVFFKQNRLGLAGRRFTLYKFRTMRQGAHDVLSGVADLNVMTTPEFKVKKTAWITPVGRFMRKFSIDELPQLINVFVGHMSVVGPRPTVPDEVEKYKDWQRRRFSMKPGITCLWQVNGRNNIAFEEWMKLDLEYLDNWSLWLDAKILLKTVPVVLFGIGAY